MNASTDIRGTVRRGAPTRRGSGSTLLLVLAGAGLLAAVVYLGGWWKPGDDEKKITTGPPPGYVAVPISATQIPEYTKVIRDHLWNRKERKIAVINIPENELSPEIKANVRDVIGRVLKHRKREGYVFTENDFFPKGTRPGIVAGIPPGRRALRLDVTKVEGVAGLVPGDVFDMVATIAVRAEKVGKVPVGGHLAPHMNIQAEMSNWAKQATVRVVVREGRVISGITTREIPISNQTFGRGRQRATIPVQEIVLAVMPDEVAPVTEALAVEAKLMVVPHSGLPGDVESRVPNHQPWTPFQTGGSGRKYGRVGRLDVVETITGTDRHTTAVPQR